MGEASLSNIDIALYALYILGGAERSVHTEDIALKCWDLVPERFSWKKYPQYPESEPARSALFDARKAKYGRLVKRLDRDVKERDRRLGSKMEWMLTDAGIDYVKETFPTLQAAVAKRPVKATSRQEVQRFLNDLEGHAAFQKFLSTGSCETIEPYEFTDFLRCTLNSSPDKIRERLEVVRNRAHDANRPQLLSFLEACAARFADLTRDGGSE